MAGPQKRRVRFRRWLAAVTALAAPRDVTGTTEMPLSPPPSPPPMWCFDDCAYQGFNVESDGDCDDGGANSLHSICAEGRDCSDCGPR